MLTWKPEEINLDRSEVLRYLGYGSDAGKVSSRTDEMLREEIARSRSLISPRGYYRVVKADALRKMEYFADARRVAFSVVTIGSGVEDKVKEMFRARDGIRAFLLDAVGTVAARKTGNLTYRRICRESVAGGYRLTRPFGPGNGNWHLEGQKLIFRFLDEKVMEKMGVSLSPSLLIKPLKSVSFAVKLGRLKMEEVVGEHCTDCSMEGKCAYVDLQ